jgi:peptide/nickel transport system substrate-binding protein
MSKKRTISFGVGIAVVVAALVIALVAVSGSNSTGPAPSASSSTSGTITFAELPQAPPNYIFPYMGFSYFSVTNISQFQQLMFRPLYWFGLGGSSAVVPSLSLAQMPKFTNGDRTVTITTKGWKFADGQPVNAQSVMFFLNLYKADPTSYAGYVPGYGIPDQVTSAHGHGNTVVLNFSAPMGPNWLLYNYLSEIVPFPNTWDITAPHHTSTCATGAFGAKSTDAACKAVEKYLDGQSAKIPTYTDAMWQSGVDGPWKLTYINALGNVTMVPNKSYSGPVKAKVAFFKEVPFTSNQAELNALESGSLSSGYVDPTQLSAPAPAPGKVGPNLPALRGKYNLVTGGTLSYNYDPLNFNAKTDPMAAVLDQLYVRQALQTSTDQVGIIKKINKGYGVVTTNPVPVNVPSSIARQPKNPYPFSLSKAKELLTSHGWSLVNGTMTCTSPGTGANQCGAGISANTAMNFTYLYASGSQALTDTVNAEVSDWKTLGINVTTSTNTFNNVISGCTPTSATQWEICSWGAGWIYSPDYYPSGEELLLKGAGSNAGSYNDPMMNAIIRQSITTSVPLTRYAAYAATQVPVLFQPTATVIGENSTKLKSSIGFTPNPLEEFMPEYLSLK